MTSTIRGEFMRDFRAIPTAVHVLRTSLGNLGPFVRMSWPWLALCIITELTFISVSQGFAALASGKPVNLQEPGGLVLMAAWFAISSAAFCSIAVNWHRFMLLGEEARGADRVRLDGTVWRYIRNLLPVSLLAFVIALSAILLIAIPFFLNGPTKLNLAGFFVVCVLIGVAVTVPYQRLLLKLPAIAIGRD